MKCSVFIATSLDGFIARKDGGIDWLSVVERPGEDYGFKTFFDSVDLLVMGRGTYDKVRSFDPWPYAGKRVVVLTHQQRTSLHGEEFFAGEPRELVRKLKRENVRHAYVDGGEVIREFLARGLIDRLTVSVIPILLGEGLPLFGPGVPEKRLTLASSEAFPSGLVQLSYTVGQ